MAFIKIKKPKDALIKSKYYPSDRYAYKTNASNPIYIPVNRIKTPYQTEEALDEDKVKSNLANIRKGKAMEPVVIGYGSKDGRTADLHDGHHRLEAAIRAKHTHVPCVVGGRNERRVKAAEKRYRKIWKSVSHQTKELGKLKKSLGPMSYNDLRQELQSYMQQEYGKKSKDGDYYMDYPWIVDVYEDEFVVESKGKYYIAKYEVNNDGDITVGEFFVAKKVYSNTGKKSSPKSNKTGVEEVKAVNKHEIKEGKLLVKTSR